MSKSSASVAVSVLFNIAIWVAPGVPDRYRLPIWYCTLALLVAACIWWAIAHWPTSGTTAGTSASGDNATGSNVASAGRDVHQTIYHGISNTDASQPIPLITFLITADHTCYSTNIWAIGPVRFLHAKILIDHGSVLCSAYLTKIAKGNEVKWEHGPEQLTFSDHTPGDPLPRTLHHGLSYNLDVLVIVFDGNEIRVCNDKREWLRWPRLSETFAEKGDYVLTITLAGNGAETRTVELQFNWTGNWQTSFLNFPDNLPVADSPRKLLRPIEIRKALDEFIQQGEAILSRWNSRNDALLTERIREQSLSWLAAVTKFVEDNFDMAHVKKLEHYGETVTSPERYHITFNLTSKAGMDTRDRKDFPVAFELSNKLQILRNFRDEI